MKQFSKDLGNVSLAPKGKWSREQEYERLALVYNACDNLSYVAKINVPSGVDIENREYWQPMNATGYADNNFINLTTENENGTITAFETLEEAVATILPINRRAGATLSFYNLNSDRLDRQAEFELWQFNSTDLANWEIRDYWNNIYYNWNVFAGWYVGADGLKNHVKIPNVGQYAYVGSNLNDALLYQCRTNGTWTNTGIKVRNYISVIVSGNITIGDNGNWFSDGEDTGIPATPAVDEQLDNIIIQLQQHATEIDKLQKQDVVLKSNIDSNFETINNKVDEIKTTTDSKIEDADANLQNQITSNDTDIATLNTKHESLSRTVQGIAATGGASTATNVTYNNDNSGLNAENAQDAIDELQGSKFDKTSILQESGEAEDKVMSQKVVSDKLNELLRNIGEFTPVLKNGGVSNDGTDSTQLSRVRTEYIDATTKDISIFVSSDDYIIRTANNYSSNNPNSHISQILAPSMLSEYILKKGYWYRVVFAKKDLTSNITIQEIEPFVKMVESSSISSQLDFQKSCILNINQLNNDFTTRYTLNTAIAAIPKKLRKSGMIISYRLSNGNYELYQYHVGSIEDSYFLDIQYWTNILTNDKYIFNINYIKNDYTTYYNINTAIANVPDELKKGGLFITYRTSVNSWELAQFIKSDISSSIFNDVNNWQIYMDKRDTLSYVQGSYDVSNGNFYNDITTAVSTKGIVVNGGHVKIIAKNGFVIRGAFLSKNNTYYKSLFSSQDLQEYEFDEFIECTLYIVIKKKDGSNITPNECNGVITIYGAVNDFDNSVSKSLYGHKVKINIETDWVQGAIDTGTGEPVNMPTRISTSFIKGGVTINCSEGLFIRSVVKYPSNTNYNNKIVVENGVSLSSYTTKNDNNYYIFTLWDGNNGVLIPTNATNCELYSFDESVGELTKLQNDINSLVDGTLIKRAKWLALGDSITEGYYSTPDGNFILDEKKGWVNYVSHINNYNVVNKGVGGSGFVRKATNDRPYNAVEIVDSIDFSSYDLITIAWGVNDWKYNMNLGSWENSLLKDNTIYGNMRYVIEKILSSNSHAKVLVITPINCKIGDKETNWGIGHRFNNNGTLEDIYEAMSTVCKYYGIELIDMTHNSVVNRININKVLLDNVHPSEECHISLARELVKKINCY